MAKDYNISRLRVIFIIWILIWHSVNGYVLQDSLVDIHYHEELEFLRGITNLVLQGFVFVSGLLFARGYILKGKYTDTKKFIIDKVKRLLVPYVFWCLALYLLYSVPLMNIIYGAKHLWFLLMLFDVFVLAIFAMPFIVKSSTKSDICIMIVFCVLLPAIIMQIHSIPNVLGWKTALAYIPPFLIAIIYVKYDINKWLNRIGGGKFGTLFMMISMITLMFIFSKYLPFGALYMHLPNYLFLPLFYSLFWRMFGSDGMSAPLQSIDKNSLGIYILHNYVSKYTLFCYVPSFVVFYDHHCVWAPIILFVLMLSLGWFSSYLMHKNRITSLLLGD